MVDDIGPVLASEERQIYLLTLELDMVDSEFFYCRRLLPSSTLKKKNVVFLLIYSFGGSLGSFFSPFYMF